jgi:hypothetical protein
MIAAPAPHRSRLPRAAVLSLVALTATASLGAASVQKAGKAAPPSDPWVHVRVVEGGAEAATVEVHLPLSAVRLGLDLAAKEAIVDGRLHLRNSDVDVADLRRLWRELRAAGDAEFVKVEDADGTVHVRRAGDRVEVRVARTDEGGEEVLVDLPVPLVDALLAGEAGTLDLAGALAQLDGFRGDLVRVREGERQVRVWIAERQETTSLRGGRAPARAEAPSRRLPRLAGEAA